MHYDFQSRGNRIAEQPYFSSEVLALILVYCHGNGTFVFLSFFSGGGLESESLYTEYLKALRMTLCMAGTIYFGVHDRGKPKPISLPSQLLVDKVNI